MSTHFRPVSSLLSALLLATSACGGGLEGQQEPTPAADARIPLQSEEDRMSLGGSVEVFDYGSVMDFIVTSGGMQVMDAKVTFDGMPVEYDMSRGSYNLVEFYGSVFHTGRSVEVCAEWEEALLCRTLTAPGAATLLMPVSQSSVSIREPYWGYWQAAAGATRYDISVLASDSSLLNFVSMSGGVSYRFTPSDYTGNATFSLAAVAVMPDSDVLGTLEVKRVSQVSFTFVP